MNVRPVARSGVLRLESDANADLQRVTRVLARRAIAPRPAVIRRDRDRPFPTLPDNLQSSCQRRNLRAKADILTRILLRQNRRELRGGEWRDIHTADEQPPRDGSLPPDANQPFVDLASHVATVGSLPLSEAEREQVLSTNARRVLGLPPPKAS